MYKLELDWAGDEMPVARPYDDEPLFVEYDDKPGPSGWPTVRVYATTNEGEEEYVASMRLVGWLTDVYGMSDDEADEIGALAERV